MQPRIETLPQKTLVGMHMTMTLDDDKTVLLWQSFMPRRKAIQNQTGAPLYSMQVYGPLFDFDTFQPTTPFEKWAVVEVSSPGSIPDGMEAYTLGGGLYAVFIHKGLPSEGARTFQYIFGTWLPQSGYAVDAREHFELLGAKYKNNDPESEEEIWIPIIRKG